MAGHTSVLGLLSSASRARCSCRAARASPIAPITTTVGCGLPAVIATTPMEPVGGSKVDADPASHKPQGRRLGGRSGQNIAGGRFWDPYTGKTTCPAVRSTRDAYRLSDRPACTATVPRLWAVLVKANVAGRWPVWSVFCRPAKARFYRGPAIGRRCEGCRTLFSTRYMRRRFCRAHCRFSAQHRRLAYPHEYAAKSRAVPVASRSISGPMASGSARCAAPSARSVLTLGLAPEEHDRASRRSEGHARPRTPASS